MLLRRRFREGQGGERASRCEPWRFFHGAKRREAVPDAAERRREAAKPCGQAGRRGGSAL
ncbi:hypothetical protein EXY28_14625 [Burkholderia pseudomallei]|nr:hypothetical protein EXY28_14625 [Burkholderia pseudomallei]